MTYLSIRSRHLGQILKLSFLYLIACGSLAYRQTQFRLWLWRLGVACWSLQFGSRNGLYRKHTSVGKRLSAAEKKLSTLRLVTLEFGESTYRPPTYMLNASLTQLGSPKPEPLDGAR